MSSARVTKHGIAEFVAVAAAATGLATVLTYPFVTQMAHVGRIDNPDGQFSIWNVAWVAHAVLRNPWQVFDANIFYPRRGTLAYSEPNLGAGVLAAPVYWATDNPYLAHNAVLLLSFVLSAVGAYYLVRHLTADRAAAAVSGICFAFCPYVFARTSHIHLMMTAGLPFSMLAFHRLVERPRPGRAIALGAVMAAAAMCTGYYGVFVALMIGLSVLLVAAIRTWWTNRQYWTAVAIAAVAAVTFIAPIFAPYLMLQRTTGFERPLQEAAAFSANWSAYLASGTLGSSWMVPFIGHFNEVLFPGFIATGFAVAGLVAGWTQRGRLREMAIIYATLGLLAFWASFGPAAGLYRVLYTAIPLFTWLRAPARFAVVVALATCVLAGIGVHALLVRVRHRTAVGVGLAICAAVELAAPLRFPTVPPVPGVYRTLATLPAGPVLEMPVYSQRFALLRTSYMLASTVHWMPLIDAYSDVIPKDFNDNLGILGDFPSRPAFALLEPIGARYVVFHVDSYQPDALTRLREQLVQFAPYLRRQDADEHIWLYEIIGFPP